MKSKVQASFLSLKAWYDYNGDKTYDVCDIGATKFYIILSDVQKKNRLGNYLTYPFFYFKQNQSDLLRKILRLKKQEYPQAYAKILRSFLLLYHKFNERSYIKYIDHLTGKLIANRSYQYKDYCWGQPYDWYSRKYIPAGTPRATVTSQVTHTFLDAYEILGVEKYLNFAVSSCRFFLDHLNYTFDEDGDFCFSYTPLDDYHIHNAGAMVASAIIRTGKIIGDKKLIDYGKRNINFIIKYQNGDGSWYYWAPPFKIIKRIDNYHTGFILESLYAVNNIIKERKYSESYNKGVKFYIHNFFESNGASKMTPEKIYPIDIQSCAQSIITLTLLLINDPLNRQIEKTRDQVLSWTLDNMQKSDGSFYYRIYKSGKIDKNSYIRWGESWMFHALSLVMSRY